MQRPVLAAIAVSLLAVSAQAQVMLCRGGPPSASVDGAAGPWVAAECTLEATTDGVIFAVASTSVNRHQTEHTQLSLRIGLDSVVGPGLVASERVLDVYGTPYLEYQSSMASLAIPVTAGTHTLYYLADRVTGEATVTLYRPRILGVFIPDGEINVRLCEGRHIGEFTTVAASQTIAASCSLTGLGLGSALVTSDGWMRLADTDAELNADLRVNQTSTAEPGTLRRLDTVGDVVYDGVDGSLATSVLAAPAPGAASFYATIGRSAGAGTVSVMWPGVSALWVASGGPVIANGAVLAGEWTWPNVAQGTMLSVDLNPAFDGYFLIVGTGSVSPDASDYTAHFKASIDLGSDIANRYVRISDTVDRNLALTDLVPVASGSHTIRLDGGRFDTASGTVLRVRDASLSVVFFPKEMVAVFSDGFEIGTSLAWSSVVP